MRACGSARECERIKKEHDKIKEIRFSGRDPDSFMKAETEKRMISAGCLLVFGYQNSKFLFDRLFVFFSNILPHLTPRQEKKNLTRGDVHIQMFDLIFFQGFCNK